MKAKKLFALLLTLAMIVSLFPAVYAAETDDPLSFADAKVTVLTPKLDGEYMNVTMYEDVYCATPNREVDQKIAIYVPENAKADAPIIFMVNNSGWQSNSYSGRNGVENYGWVEKTRMGQKYTTLAGNYVSDSDSDAIGKALSEGYVIVSCGARSRNNGANEDGLYLGHSPATMTDTKAAFRYLRYNADLLPAGDPEKIVVTGTSGGGALSVVLAASGDSKDYYESLYEIGAAGIKKIGNTYVSTISDAVWGTIAYCPITDLGNACSAYEWTWGETRTLQMEEGVISYGVDAATQNAASAELTALFEEYIDSLGIGVNSKNLEETIIGLMKTEIEESIKEVGIEQMRKDLADYDWLVINDDGTFEYDYEAHKYAVGLESTFKAASAFSNAGMSAWKGERNEDNLFGTITDEYSPYNQYSWNHDDTPNAVGKDDTGLTWDEYMATEGGKYLAKQMKMTSPIQYLLSDTDGVSAPHWYVRYGMYDRDSSWAIETVLLYAMKADKSIEDISFEFAWLKGHSGNYDVQEAYAWLAEALAETDDPLSFADAKVTVLTPKLDGEDIEVYMYEDVYCATPNREVDQQIAIYVPENATPSSPIIFMVNNSGWQSNAYSGRNGVKSYGTEIGRNGKESIVGNYSSNSDSDAVGKALSEGYVIVSCGARSRNNGANEDGLYLGHSPATMTDTKAAFRYLRYNADLLPAGDPEKIVVTGTSGGGALSVVLAASGDSADYYESLYEIGAAGIEKVNGKYVSTISDAVWGTIAYCPITDLGNACSAYEWTWGETRTLQMEEGVISYGVDAATQNAASAELTALFEEYIDSLGIGVNSKNLEETIIGLMKTEIEESIKEVGIEQMRKDLADYDWLVINDDGTFEYDYEAHKYAVGLESTFKAASAFSNAGMSAWKGERNEDNLFGTITDEYSPYNQYSWNHDDTPNAVGKDDTGLTWDEYMATDAGKYLAKQMKMTSPIQYLLSDTDGVSAPHWYVRYGMYDRDSSWAIETVLLYAMKADKSIEDISFEFAWLKGHSGNYDVQEAYAWLAKALGQSAPVATNQTVTVDGEVVAPEAYNVNGENYFKLRDIAYLLNGTAAQFAVDYIEASRTVYVTTGEAYVAIGGELVKGSDKSATCVPTNQDILIDALLAKLTAYNFDGANYFRLRDLGEALGFSVGYDEATRTVIIETK